MSSARHYHLNYTIADYLLWEGNWEQLYGTAVALSPSPFGRHARVVAEFVSQIDVAVSSRGCDCVVYAGLDWIVQNDTVIRPDVMIVCGEQPQRYLERPPILAIEVLSESTANKDRTVMRERFESHGVEHYLIVDPLDRSIHWRRLQINGKYVDCSSNIGTAGPFSIGLSNGCILDLDPRTLFK